MLSVKPKYCFRPQLGLRLAFQRGLGFLNSYVITSACILPLVCSVQSAFYIDRIPISFT